MAKIVNNVNPNRKLQSSPLRAALAFCGQVAWAAVHVHAGTGLHCQVEAFLWSAIGLLISLGPNEVQALCCKSSQSIVNEPAANTALKDPKPGSSYLHIHTKLVSSTLHV